MTKQPLASLSSLCTSLQAIQKLRGTIYFHYILYIAFAGKGTSSSRVWCAVSCPVQLCPQSVISMVEKLFANGSEGA